MPARGLTHFSLEKTVYLIIKNISYHTHTFWLQEQTIYEHWNPVHYYTICSYFSSYFDNKIIFNFHTSYLSFHSFLPLSLSSLSVRPPSLFLALLAPCKYDLLNLKTFRCGFSALSKCSLGAAGCTWGKTSACCSTLLCSTHPTTPFRHSSYICMHVLFFY